MARRRSGGGFDKSDLILWGGLGFILYKAGALGSLGIANAGGGVPTMTQAQLATIGLLGNTGVLPVGVLSTGSIIMNDGSTILPNGQLVAA